MIDIIRHWNPNIKKHKNRKDLYVSKYCPICDYTSKKNYIFKYNKKLNVCKCYSCGKSFKTIHWFLKQLKEHRLPKVAKREYVYYGDKLPF